MVEKEIKCPNCGEVENLHPNYDYEDYTLPIIDYLCNECGQFFYDKDKNEEDD